MKYTALQTLFLLIFLNPVTSFAWGRRGHEIVGQTAAYLASGEEGASALKSHSFDIGYYCNVPDFFWKRPATYETEKPQHFMDLELFERAFAKRPEVKDPFQLSRAEFESTFPELKVDAGRAYWRIREMDAQLENYGKQLKALNESATSKERQAIQEKWILIAGVMGHYVGDLSMPLHVSENYDGNLTDQKGIHSFFEDTCVDDLFPKLAAEVAIKARSSWPAFKKNATGKSVLELLQTLTDGSKKEVKTLLAIDKRNSREKVAKTCAQFDDMISSRMAASSLVLAELYRRSLGWKFDDNRFYFFKGEPEYIMPGEEKTASTAQGSR